MGREASSAAMKSQGVRKYPRANVNGLVFIHDDEQLKMVPALNISAGGVYVSRLTAFKPGTTVRLVIKCRDLSYPIQAVGSVVRVEKEGRQGTAVVFTNISLSSRERLQTFVLKSKLGEMRPLA